MQSNWREMWHKLGVHSASEDFGSPNDTHDANGEEANGVPRGHLYRSRRRGSMVLHNQPSLASAVGLERVLVRSREYIHMIDRRPSAEGGRCR
jgi:hypothetical protein